MSSFKDLRIVDNFYQTSAFFPMPTILVSTLCEDGLTSIGSYSLCSPYYVAGKEDYTMLLCLRNNSNTARNILNNSKCALNFITAKNKYFKEAVRLGYPGDEPKEKMKDLLFELEEGMAEGKRPKVISEAFQVFECTWLRELDGASGDKVQESYSPPYHDFNGITSETGAHFILRIDKILMKEKYRNTIVNGTKASGFPDIPIDYGYRDNTHFWYAKSGKPRKEPIPKKAGMNVQVVVYASERIDPDVRFTEEACEKLVKVPRVFLNTVLKSCVNWAKENDVSLITKEHMQTINDKRSEEKSK